MSILIAILIFGFLIFIHELGHYLMARLFHVGIHEFAIGMGPKLLTKTSKKTGIKYSLRALPIGGYVSMEGEDEENTADNSINTKPIWQRFLVMVAGSVMNLLCGLILTGVLVGMLHDSLGSTKVAYLTDTAIESGAQLKAGDVILSVNGEKVHTSYDLQYTLFREGKDKNTVKVKRDGEVITLHDVSFTETVKVDTETENGIEEVEVTRYVFRLERDSFTVGTFFKHTFNRAFTTVEMVWESVFDLITGKYGLEQMSGPVGITKEIGNAATEKDGGKSLINLTALIALNLGVMNLLPFPALDGGRIVFLVIEGIRRKPLSKQVEGYIHMAGMLLLLLLMLLVTFQDVTRLF